METNYKKLVGYFPECLKTFFRQNTNVCYLFLLCITLAAIVIAVYMQVGSHQFVALDDYDYVTKNPHIVTGLNVENVIWAFTTIDYFYWQPVTWLSHMVDVQLFGMNPQGHHLTNVAIHTSSTLILLIIFLRLTGALWQSFFVAAMFALHPLHVESVAWVAERKDVLSAFFWFLTLLCYSEYAVKHKPLLYILSLIFFVLGLMSKPMLITLPIVMLLVDYWPLDRFGCEKSSGEHQLLRKSRALIIEKIPFIFLSFVSAIITVYGHGKFGALPSANVFPILLRIENSLTAYVKYIGKTIWPQNLAVYYPFPLSIPLWQAIGSLFILLIISVYIFRARHRHPFLLVGWFWFLVSLVPVIGLTQAGGASMADRFTYIPGIGLFIIVAWGFPNLTKGMRYSKSILILFAVVVIIASTVVTWRQLGFWKDSISLFRHTLQVTTDNDLIHYNLGNVLLGSGDFNSAIHEFREALRIFPYEKDAHKGLAHAYLRVGNFDAAIMEYEEALRLDPNDQKTRSHLSFALQKKRIDNSARKARQVRVP